MGEEGTEGVKEEEGRKEGFVSKGAVAQEKFIGRGGQKSRCPGAKANKERSCLLLHCTDETEEVKELYRIRRKEDNNKKRRGEKRRQTSS